MIIKIIKEVEQTQTIWQQIRGDVIVGAITSLLGAVIGWYLNELSNRGKLSVYLKSWSEEFWATNDDKQGGYEKIPNKPENYKYKMTLEIYNSSGIPRILRDIKVVFRKRNKVLQSDTPKDESKEHSSKALYYYEDIGAYNVPANEIMTITLLGYYSKNKSPISFLREADSIWLEYKNEKNRTKRKLIKRISYESVFENDTEDTENG